jgi:hypothetical protein
VRCQFVVPAGRPTVVAHVSFLMVKAGTEVIGARRW